MGQRMKRIGGVMAGVGAGMTAGLTMPLMGFFRMAAGEMAEMQLTMAQTNAVIKSTGGQAGVSARHVQSLAQSLSDMSGIDDEVIVGMENLLLTFPKIKKAGGIFDATAKSALDMSVALGTDQKTAAMQLGKALQDPTRGLLALRRSGVNFTKAQEKQIKSWVAHGKIAKAQKAILAEVNKEFAGSAKAAGETLPGQLNKLKNRFAEVGASLLTALLPAINDLVDFIGKVIAKFEAMPAGVRKVVAIMLVLGLVVGPIVGIVGALAFALAAIGTTGLVIGAVIAGAVIQIIALGVAMKLLYDKSETARRAMRWLYDHSMLKQVVAVGQAMNTAAKKMGGWGVVFRTIYVAFLDMLKGILDGTAKLLRKMAEVPGVPRKMANSMRSAARSMEADSKKLTREIKKVKGAIDNIKTAKAAKEMERFGRTGKLSADKVRRAIKMATDEGNTMEARIAAWRAAWDNWKPKPKTLTLTQQLVKDGNAPAWNYPGLGPPKKTARGGVFHGAQFRMIGEAGPEAVVPLSPGRAGDRARVMSQAGLSGGGGGPTYQITFSGPVMGSPAEFGRAVVKALESTAARQQTQVSRINVGSR